MARTITEIKATITTEFMGSDVMATIYGFTKNDSFDERFSKVSFESILFYIIAFVAFTIEKLFDTHKQEVSPILPDVSG